MLAGIGPAFVKKAGRGIEATCASRILLFGLAMIRSYMITEKGKKG